MSRQPPGAPPPPPVQKVRLRYTKRGRLRFTSHRDIARVFERALRRAGVPMAFSAGFSPHPKISWVGAAATGVASEAEYVDIALAEQRDPEELRQALDASLPDGIDVVEAVTAPPGTSLADLVTASLWRIELPGVAVPDLERAVAAFEAAASVEVERMTKNGRRTFDTRTAVVSLTTGPGDGCAILTLVVQHVTPAVRPDDVLSGLRAVSDLTTPVPPSVTRLAQGPLTADGGVGDPLAPDRVAAG
ncbi:MAG TPA: TIGR03936 family radical SAM-associated protein [Mycobacteriales bacterium]|nr:TIGR03936 family radical SAM-associated protein [Mycobacteriales bacterium]